MYDKQELTQARNRFIIIQYMLQRKSPIQRMYKWKTTLICITFYTSFEYTFSRGPLGDEKASQSKRHHKNQNFNNYSHAGKC